jgi:hypothetical protein
MSLAPGIFEKREIEDFLRHHLQIHDNPPVREKLCPSRTAFKHLPETRVASSPFKNQRGVITGRNKVDVTHGLPPTAEAAPGLYPLYSRNPLKIAAYLRCQLSGRSQ